MGSFLAVIGFLGFTVFIILAIVSAIRKTRKGKKMMLFAAGCFVIMIIGGALSPEAKETSGSTSKVEDTSKKKEVSAKQKAADEAKQKDEAQKKAEADAKKKAEEEAAAKKKADEEAGEEKAKQIQPGTYEVGKDVQPGLYRTDGDISYWARLKGLSGDLYEILANGNPLGPDVIQILPTDKAFETQGSGYWTRIDGIYNPTMLTSFGDGTYNVGKDIAPGK